VHWAEKNKYRSRGRKITTYFSSCGPLTRIFCDQQQKLAQKVSLFFLCSHRAKRSNPLQFALCIVDRYFTRARARCGPDFTFRGRRVEASHLLKRQSENFEVVGVAVLILGLRHVLLTMAISIFLVRIFLLIRPCHLGEVKHKLSNGITVLIGLQRLPWRSKFFCIGKMSLRKQASSNSRAKHVADLSS
jgi:hypothetical protein